MAVYYGKYNIVTYFVDKYGDQLKDLQYLLHVCVRNSFDDPESIENKIMVTEFLVTELSKYHGVNWKDEMLNNRQPLLESNVHLKLLQLLVKLGADINAISTTFGTVLHTSHNRCDNHELVRWALQSGFNKINQCDREGRTPLMAIMDWHVNIKIETFELLVQAGAKFDVKDNDGNSLLLHALKSGQGVSIINRLLAAEQKPECHTKGRNVLHDIFSSWADLSCPVASLLFENFDINATDDNGLTPLLCQVSSKRDLDFELIKLFHAKGADFKAADKFRSVLFHAVKKGQNAEVASKLIELGADPYYKNVEDCNVLHISVAYANSSMLKFFLENFTFDVNVADRHGDTPLHKAFSEEEKRYGNVLRIMFETGAQSDIKNNNGHTPLGKWMSDGKCKIDTLQQLNGLPSSISAEITATNSCPETITQLKPTNS